MHPCSPHCYNQTCDRFNGRCLYCCINGFHGEMCNESKTTLFFFSNLLNMTWMKKSFDITSIDICIKNFHAFFLINYFYMYQHTNMRFWFAVFDSFFIGHVMLKQIKLDQLDHSIYSFACYQLYFYQWCMSVMQVRYCDLINKRLILLHQHLIIFIVLMSYFIIII